MAAKGTLGAIWALLLCACPAPFDSPGRADDRYEVCASEIGEHALAEAHRLLDAGDRRGAIGPLRAALLACPELVPAHLLYQDTARELRGEIEARMRRFYAGLSMPDSPVAPFLRARLLPDDDEADRQELFEQALALDRSFYYAYLGLARLWRRVHREERALEELRQATAARPGFLEARRELAEVLEKLGHYEEAQQHYTTYLEARPGDREVRKAQARLWIYHLGKPAWAEASILFLLADEPEDPALLMDRAAIHWRLSRYVEAVRTYHRVLSLDPSRDLAVLNIANLYYEPMSGLRRRASAEEVAKARRAAWPKARNAYRYYRLHARIENLLDFLDAYGTAAMRIREIDAELGPGGPADPSFSDF